MISNDNYETINLLASGEQGQVYVVREIKTNCFYVCKKSNIEFLSHKNEVMSQKKMGRYAANIIESWFDFKENNSYIIMEKAGDNLYDFLRYKRGYDVIESITHQLIEILDILQNKKIVHGDMAFFNIGVFTARGNTTVKLLDFGDSLMDCSPEVLRKELDFLRLWVEIYCTNKKRSRNCDYNCHSSNIKIMKKIFHSENNNRRGMLLWSCIDRLYEESYNKITEIL
jgi:serine/threonine protein kinase